VKKLFGDQVLSIFIEPPSIEVLEQRLVRRGTDNAENISMRVNKARDEMQYKNSFDKVILNDDIEKATAETAEIVKQFIGLK
jgi:guanylate kinase